jgi:choline dehydrogenase-like flavoprotein
VVAQVEGVYVDAEGTTLDTFDHLTDDELARWLVSHPGPVAHPAATCSPVLVAHPDPGAGHGSGMGVVDLDGAIRGYQGLSVIDGSTLPYLPAANPQLPIMALADRLSSDC